MWMNKKKTLMVCHIRSTKGRIKTEVQFSFLKKFSKLFIGGKEIWYSVVILFFFDQKLTDIPIGSNIITSQCSKSEQVPSVAAQATCIQKPMKEPGYIPTGQNPFDVFKFLIYSVKQNHNSDRTKHTREDMIKETIQNWSAQTSFI